MEGWTEEESEWDSTPFFERVFVCLTDPECIFFSCILLTPPLHKFDWHGSCYAVCVQNVGVSSLYRWRWSYSSKTRATFLTLDHSTLFSFTVDMIRLPKTFPRSWWLSRQCFTETVVCDKQKLQLDGMHSKERFLDHDRKKENPLNTKLVHISFFLTFLENDPVPETVAQLAQEVYSNNLLQLLVDNIAKFEFEAKKDVAQIFNNLLRRHIGSRSPTVEYLCTRDQILFTLIQGYENQEIALNCGMILRECLRHEVLTKIVLNSQKVYKFFDYVEMNTFDIASDAFATFKEILSRHKTLVAEFLERNYDEFFEKYTQLLQSTNYVTKRQSLKLLGEILLDRANFTIMTRYIANADNLKLMMNLLKDRSRNIQFEAFHVFKVFVANPNKNKPVLDILSKNQDKLISFLSTFHNDRNEDEQFNDEKAFLLKQIQDL
ncbi:MAG: Mo25-like-domain-containing protein [Podila humilis]|nr:MAG: Mo25-like-domain-containing protein [Podila humilis]